MVFLELGLAAIRLATLTGVVIYRDDLAKRIAPPVLELCSRAGCGLPKVVLRNDAIRAACVRRGRERVLLILSVPFLDTVDDRQLRAILAHEVIHIARNDLRWAKARASVTLLVTAAAGIGVWHFEPGGVVLPVYMAAGVVAAMVAQVSLSVLNRPLERRADAEGALLCGDPAGLAGALGTAHAFSEQARLRVHGARPWRWLLSPLSWQMPSHPPMAERLRRLQDLSAAKTS